MTWSPSAASSRTLTQVRATGLLILALATLPAFAQGDAASAPEAAAPAPAAAPLPVPATPQSPPSISASPEWKSLGLAQRWALEPLERDWDALDPARRSKWLEIAQRFPSLPEEERKRMHERMRAWSRLTPEQREQARLGYQVVQQVKAAERQAKWEAYQALSPEKRQELAEKAAHKQAPKSRTVTETATLAKSNLVPAQLKSLPVKPVAPSVLQAKPGVTTVLITETSKPPEHQQAGQTKVFADPERVDSKTLLPKQRIMAEGTR